MDQAYQCFSCGKLSAFSDNEKCPSCGSARIRVLSADDVRELMRLGSNSPPADWKAQQAKIDGFLSGLPSAPMRSEAA